MTRSRSLPEEMYEFSWHVPGGQPGETTPPRRRPVLFPAFVLFEQMDGISQAWSTLSAVIPNTSCCRSVSLLDILPFCSPALFLPLATYFPSVPSSTQPRGLFPVKWLGYLGEGGGVLVCPWVCSCMMRWIVCRCVQEKRTRRWWRRFARAGCRETQDGSDSWDGTRREELCFERREMKGWWALSRFYPTQNSKPQT